MYSPVEFFNKLDSFSDDKLWDLLSGWHGHEKAEEIEAFVNHIENLIRPKDLSLRLFDCAGTGGDNANTFNISTCSAIVASAFGIKIAKNGGRSSTSKTGSVDVLEALGVNFKASLEQRLDLLKRYNLGFFSSEISAKLLSRVKALSKQYKKTTFISLIAPLLGPVCLEGQIIGLAKATWQELIRDVYKNLIKNRKRKRVLLVHSWGIDFVLDELSTASKSRILDISESKEKEFFLCPEDLDIQTSSLESLSGGNPLENAQIILKILENNASSPQLETVLMNVALLLYLSQSEIPDSQDEFIKIMRTNYQKSKNLIETKIAYQNFTAFLNSNII